MVNLSEKEWIQQYKNKEDIKADLWNIWKDVCNLQSMWWELGTRYTHSKKADNKELDAVNKNKHTVVYLKYIRHLKYFWNLVKHHLNPKIKYELWNPKEAEIKDILLADKIQRDLKDLFKTRGIDKADNIHDMISFAVKDLFDLSTEFTAGITPEINMIKESKPPIYKQKKPIIKKA